MKAHNIFQTTTRYTASAGISSFIKFCWSQHPPDSSSKL